jgi:protein-disulfide isomerase
MKTTKERTLDSAIAVVAICALVSTTLAAYRTFRPEKARPQPAVEEVRDWRTYAAIGHRIGPPDARITIVEFSDFECSFCRRAAHTFRAARAKYGEDIAIVYRHFPLERIHPAARKIAVASVCAARQGRFEQYHDALFAQDSIVLTRLTQLAGEAGVADTRAFERCLSDPTAEEVVDRDVLDAKRLEVQGTPTVLINQYRLTQGASATVVDSVVSALLGAQKSP